MADTVKVTKVAMFNMIIEALKTSNVENVDEMVDFCETQIAQAEAKAEKAKERRDAKRIESDEIRKTVLSCVTEDWQSVDQITAAVNDPEITKSKVVARLTALVKEGAVEKDQIKIEDKKVSAYRLTATDAE